MRLFGKRPARVASVHEGASDEEIVNEAWRLAGDTVNAKLAAHQMEMTRRLIVSQRAFKASSDRWQMVLAVFTFALIVVAIESAYLAWVLLERGG